MSNNPNPDSPVAAPAQVSGVRVSSTSERQPGDDIVEHARQQVQDIQLEQRAGAASQPDSPVSQEDAEMADAESTSQVPRSSASVSNSSGTSSSSAAASNPLDAIKKLVWRRDSLVRLLLDMVEGTDINDEQGLGHVEGMRTKVEELNRLISTVKQSAKLSESHVAASITGENEGISLSKQDLPKFQLRSHATKYFPNEVTYDSVHHFLRSFEKVILSSGKAVENVWRRYIPLTIPYDLDLWLSQDMVDRQGEIYLQV